MYIVYVYFLALGYQSVSHSVLKILFSPVELFGQSCQIDQLTINVNFFLDSLF